MMMVKKKKIKEENEDDEYVKSSQSSTPLLLPRLDDGRTSLCLLWCCCCLLVLVFVFFFNLTRTGIGAQTKKTKDGFERDVCFSLSLFLGVGGLSMSKKKKINTRAFTPARTTFSAL